MHTTKRNLTAGFGLGRNLTTALLASTLLLVGTLSAPTANAVPINANSSVYSTANGIGNNVMDNARVTLSYAGNATNVYASNVPATGGYTNTSMGANVINYNASVPEPGALALLLLGLVMLGLSRYRIGKRSS
jgi:hypothetical protein